MIKFELKAKDLKEFEKILLENEILIRHTIIRECEFKPGISYRNDSDIQYIPFDRQYHLKRSLMGKYKKSWIKRIIEVGKGWFMEKR